ncbi:hypothetical protein McanCB56680_004691 [Microsporum canis]|uniref:Aminoglycoside phosphotransferase domain-containing protein n=1 Tax=Arthroderma otae (strain ATCC MYA-4605 / CBS 113480) TaxID=554155 RepID=C5FZL6_ARTOC|nr:conserved hypothetical protein [Microsporum canis CBS 113480]EEQ35319.1 conserved hypothetical protein [Microsporum canis CBS 113480]
MDAALHFLLRYSPPVIARWIVQYAPQAWLVRLCKRVEQKQRDQHAVVAPVLRISPHIAVNRGLGVQRRRAIMQNYAYRRLNPSIVRVPQVYRFFLQSTGHSLPDGYLFMEYIPGQTLEQLDTTAGDNSVSRALTTRLAKVVAHLQEIEAEDDAPPGPVGGGMSQGYLWGDEGTKTVFKSVEDMNLWLNKRLNIISKSIDLAPCYPLVLVHGDLCRRNIIVVDGGSTNSEKESDCSKNQLCLVDWDFAALLPRVFETTAMLCYNDDWAYSQGLLQATKKEIGGLTELEEECSKLLMRARAGSLRYSF